MKPASSGQLMLSIGALLASEREKRGIAVEKAAKETRMRPQRIRDMESDDLSHFTNPSYARMFIIAYAKYLDIPMQTIRDHLPDRGESAAEGYQYIAATPAELPSLRRDLVSRPLKRNTALHAFLIITALVIFFGGGGIIFYLVVNANRLTAAVDRPPQPEPTPKIVVVAPPPRPDIHLSSLDPSPAQSSTFEKPIEIAAPPSPVPATVEVEKPAPKQTAVTAPAPAPTKIPVAAEAEDRAFLLGSSPDQKTPQN